MDYTYDMLQRINTFGANEHGQAKTRRNKKQSPPESDHPPPTDRPDASGADGGRLDGDESRTMGPLSPAERRDRKVRARAARMEELRLKKEEALRDERLAKLDHQDDHKGFTLKVGLDTDCCLPLAGRIVRRRACRALLLAFP